MKIDRHGRAKILTQREIQLLFSEGLSTTRDRCLFGICLYTACRIAEACSLRRADVYDSSRQVRPELPLFCHFPAIRNKRIAKQNSRK